MAVLSRLALAASLAFSCGVSADQIPLKNPLEQVSASPSHANGIAGSRPLIDSEALQRAISIDALMERAEKLYDIAKASEDEYGHPTRVIGSPGHAGTRKYIRDTLESLGDYYNISTQDFPVVSGNVYESRLVLGDTVPKSASPMGLTPATKHKQPVYGDLVLVKNHGCESSDYPNKVKGNIAFISRGTCSFGAKSKAAGKAGAVAAVIYNTDSDELHGTLGEPTPDHVATFGLSGTDGKKFSDRLDDGEAIDAIAFIDAELQKITTTNIIAQTVEGDTDNIVMLGGHSDSVQEGPGLNDDGSGSLSVLEVAVQLTEFKVKNAVRFSWWSAEEEGLLGSDYYAASLSKKENKKIRLFMDYDMMASPNFAYQIYNATNDVKPAGSQELRDLYIDWYENQGLNYTLIPFDSRSDYAGFLLHGIPSGGIATGAEVLKTKEEEEAFGGVAGQAFDVCYHLLCDNLSNLNTTAWTVNTKLIAHSVATYALSFKGFPERTDEVQTERYGQESKYHGHKLIM